MLRTKQKKLIYDGILKATEEKRAVPESGAGSGSVIKLSGSANPDLDPKEKSQGS